MADVIEYLSMGLGVFAFVALFSAYMRRSKPKPPPQGTTMRLPPRRW